MPGVLVQGLFPVGRLFLTHFQGIGYAGFGHSRSQYVESRLDDPVAEILASQSTLGHAPRRITRQVCRRLYSQLGGRLPESSSPITSRTGSAPGRQCAMPARWPGDNLLRMKVVVVIMRSALSERLALMVARGEFAVVGSCGRDQPVPAGILASLMN